MSRDTDEIRDLIRQIFGAIEWDEPIPKSPRDAIWLLYPAVRHVLQGELEPAPKKEPALSWSVRTKISIRPYGEEIWRENEYQPEPVVVHKLVEVYDEIGDYVEAELGFTPSSLSDDATERRVPGLSVSMSNGFGACVQQWLFENEELQCRYNVRALVVRGDYTKEETVAKLLADGSGTFPLLEARNTGSTRLRIKSKE